MSRSFHFSISVIALTRFMSGRETNLSCYSRSCSSRPPSAIHSFGTLRKLSLLHISQHQSIQIHFFHFQIHIQHTSTQSLVAMSNQFMINLSSKMTMTMTTEAKSINMVLLLTVSIVHLQSASGGCKSSNRFFTINHSGDLRFSNRLEFTSQSA